MPDKKTQIEKFRRAARAHEADESEDAFNAALKAVTAGKEISPAIDRLADQLDQTDQNFTKDRKPKRGD